MRMLLLPEVTDPSGDTKHKLFTHVRFDTEPGAFTVPGGITCYDNSSYYQMYGYDDRTWDDVRLTTVWLVDKRERKLHCK